MDNREPKPYRVLIVSSRYDNARRFAEKGIGLPREQWRHVTDGRNAYGWREDQIVIVYLTSGYYLPYDTRMRLRAYEHMGAKTFDPPDGLEAIRDWVREQEARYAT